MKSYWIIVVVVVLVAAGAWFFTARKNSAMEAFRSASESLRAVRINGSTDPGRANLPDSPPMGSEQVNIGSE